MIESHMDSNFLEVDSPKEKTSVSKDPLNKDATSVDNTEQSVNCSIIKPNNFKEIID